MRTEKCLTCRNYTEEKDRTGREWMNATGWCDLPRLHTKRRRIDKDNWCDQYVEGDTTVEISGGPVKIDIMELVEEPVSELTAAIGVVGEHEDESFGTMTKPSFEHWKLSLREAIWDIKASLDALDTLANTPYEDEE
jgi:hypothetical protein